MLFLLLACGEKTSEDTATVEDTATETVEEAEETTSDTISNDVDTSICADDYAMCGLLNVPSDYVGNPRSLAVVLYDTIPPAGPPQHILTEIENPELVAGEKFQVAVHPVLASGEYYIWINLYMEGGGEWVPVNDVEYIGATGESVIFDGSSVQFDNITLEIATGW